MAELLGHEAGLFCATGSLANLLGVRLLVEPGQEVLCDVQAHIARAEMGAHAAVHGLTMRTFPSVRGRLDPVGWPRSSPRTPGPIWCRPRRSRWRTPTTSAAARSKTAEQLPAVGGLCREHGVGYHLDGARLWNAHVATGVALADYGRLFDTVSVCFSKGLGAPVGLDAGQHRGERSLGPGCSANGSAAGCARPGSWPPAAGYALDHQLARLADDHAAARGVRRGGGRALRRRRWTRRAWRPTS